ncbi:MAG: hypothetical protein AAFQ89_02520 [Cyanobacteria bacterium J06626_18]
MTAAFKSEEMIPRSRVRASRRQLTVLPNKRQKRGKVPVHLAPKHRFPLWLKLMFWGQWISFGVAVVAIAGALAAYALTVNTNRQLTLATSTLERLQDQQQQLTAANAAFKNHLAETALTTLKANTLHPRNVIFLEAVEEQASTPETEAVPMETRPSENRAFPQGY